MTPNGQNLRPLAPRRLKYRPLLAGPSAVFMASIDGRPVVAAAMSLEIDSAILALDSLVMAACIAGKNVLVLLDSGELRIYSLSLALLACRQVAIPGEWGLAKPLLAADRSGSAIVIGLAGSALLHYSFVGNQLRAVGSLQLPPFVRSVGLITPASSSSPVVWSFSLPPSADCPAIKLEPSPGSLADFATVRLPLQGSALFALSLDTNDGGSLIGYDDQVRYVSIQDIISGRTALKSFSIGKITAWTVEGSRAYLIARGTLYCASVLDGQLNVDSLLTDSGSFSLARITQFSVFSRQGRTCVEYCTPLERGRFGVQIASNEISNQHSLSRFALDFQFGGQTNQILTKVKHPPGLCLLQQASFAAVLGDYKELCPPFVTGLFFVAECDLFIVSSVTKSWLYQFKAHSFRLVKTVDKPVLAAHMTRDSLLVATPSGVVALSPYFPHNEIVAQDMALSKAWMGFGLCGVILETGDALIVDPGLVNPPQIIPVHGMVYFVKPVDANTVAVGLEREVRLYDAKRLEIIRSVPSAETVTDALLVNGGLVLAHLDGTVLFRGVSRRVSNGAVLLESGAPDLVAQSEFLYKVDSHGVSTIHFGTKMMPQKVKALCRLGTEYMVATESTLLRVRLDNLPTTALPKLHFLPTPKKVQKIVQAPHIRAILALSGGRVTAFDAKYYEPLAIVWPHSEQPLDTFLMWTIMHAGQKYNHLVVYARRDDEVGLVRTYTAVRKRQTLTFTLRMKKEIESSVTAIVSTTDALFYVHKGLPNRLMSLKLADADHGLRLVPDAALELDFAIAEVTPYHRKLFVCGDAGLFVFDSMAEPRRSVAANGRVICAPENCRRCLVKTVDGKTLLYIAVEAASLIVLCETAEEYALEQVVNLPHPVAEMHFSHNGSLVLLLTNSDFVEVSGLETPVLTIY